MTGETYRPGQIVSWTMGAPDTWGTWPPHEAGTVIDALAAKLTDDPEGAGRVREAVLALDANLPPGSLLSAGVWVPDRSTGQVHGTLLAEGLVDLPDVPDPVGWFVSTMSSAPRRRGVRTFEYAITRTDLPAGPAAVQSWTSAHRRSRDVVSTLVWTVVPTGSVEAIGVEFSTHVPALADALYAESVDVLMSLRVEIA